MKYNENLTIEKIDPKIETEKHIEEIIAQNEGKLSPEGHGTFKRRINNSLYRRNCSI